LKFLLLVLGLFVAYWIFKAYKRKISSGAKPPAESGNTAEDMVRCAQCGVHMPRSESLMSGQAFYCTPEHRRLHQEND
jgi:uncharacterized protein